MFTEKEKEKETDYATDEDIRRYCAIKEQLSLFPMAGYYHQNGIYVSPVEQRMEQLIPRTMTKKQADCIRLQVLKELPKLETELFDKLEANEERDRLEEEEFEKQFQKEMRYQAFKQRKLSQMSYNKLCVAGNIIGMKMQDVINYFSNLKPLYFRPVVIDDVMLMRDGEFDEKRCNVVFKNNRVEETDGWY